MSSFKSAADVLRESQDSTERHLYDEMSVGEGGARVAVKGNGTEDDDCAVLAIGGTIMRLPKGTNAEVFLLSGGDDTNVKFAIVVGPRDKQHKPKEGEAWTQDPMEADKRVGFTPKGVRIVGTKKGTIAIGDKGEIEVDKDGEKIYFRGQVYFDRPPTTGTKAFEE